MATQVTLTGAVAAIPSQVLAGSSHKEQLSSVGDPNGLVDITSTNDRHKCKEEHR